MAKKKSSHGAAAANGNGHHAAPPPGKAEEYVTEETRDSSPELDRKAEQLKTLNTMLLKEAVERRGQVAALTARLDELSADDAALAAAERAVTRAALAAPLRAAADEVSALRARLAAVQNSLRLAESREALEADAKDETNARLEAAAGEKARFLKLLQAKEAEVASMPNKVSSLEATVAELEGNYSELFGENGELMKQLEETKEEVRVVSAQKAEVEMSLQEFKKAADAYRVEMEEKVKAKVEELKVLGAKKAEMDAMVAALEVELAAALAKRGDLEAEVVAKKRDFDFVKGENDKLRSEVAAAEKKHSMSVAEVDKLGMELCAMAKAKEVAAKAFDAEKTEIVRELEGLKRKVEEIQANKEAAEGATREKDAQAYKVRDELDDFHVSMLQLQASCHKPEGIVIGKAPLFDGSNYACWKIRMSIYLKAMSLSIWKIVNEGYVMPLNSLLLTDQEERNAHLDAQAMNALFYALNMDEFNRVSNLETAHDIWTTLSEIHEGTSTVKEVKLHRLWIKYETFIMLPNENINEMYSRLNNIVNELKGLDTYLLDVDIVRKILRTLPNKYETLVTLFLNSPELPRMTPTGLLGNLITNELFKKDKKELLESSSSKKKITAFKAKAELSDDEAEERDSEEEFAFLMRRMKKFMRRRPHRSFNFDKSKKGQFSSDNKHYSNIRCYNCEEKGHNASHCPLKKDDKGKSFKKEYDGKKKLFKKFYKECKYEVHIGEWDSNEESTDSDEDECPKKKGLVGIAIKEAPSRFSTPTCLMAKGDKLPGGTPVCRTRTSLRPGAAHRLHWLRLGQEAQTRRRKDDGDDEAELLQGVKNQQQWK